MGNPSSSQPQPRIQHFSHEHPLQLSNHQPRQTLNLASCSCCKLPVSAGSWIYSCPKCSYFLHLNCSQTPLKIKHPFHPNHDFSLLCSPTYPQGFFYCDACGKRGNGFSYHCKACSLDLHVPCASMPLTTTHPCHRHQLNLIFSPRHSALPYRCDICMQSGSKHWLYRCDLCDFDAHLDCAATKPAASVHNPVHQTQQSQAPPTFNPAFQLAPGPQFPARPPWHPGAFGSMNSQNYQFSNPAVPSSPSVPHKPTWEQHFHAIMAENARRDAEQAQLLQQMQGNGGNGNYLQLLQQMAGGGGGRNPDYTQILQQMAGGGGSSDFSSLLQGSGGSVDFSSLLQNLGGIGSFLGFGF
ncbi:uncharacterized protein LOC127802602 [Diospyros lotus]|uniref:uncharacterized protein LOC127802602 n=1 Tax=Diospyros lotus TaxID=55363 RepID=UPI002258AD15|nr:uncharacterized protein LOC127802602 [Diospyros lotus]